MIIIQVAHSRLRIKQLKINSKYFDHLLFVLIFGQIAFA